LGDEQFLRNAKPEGQLSNNTLRVDLFWRFSAQFRMMMAVAVILEE